jgi:phage/plasmid-associated DNA primase
MILPTFGEYARSCDDSVLKKPFDHSVPEPVLAGLRGRRLAYNTEVAKSGKLCANNLKKLADMRGATLNPRFLHQNNPPAWRPSALVVIAFNGTRDFDEYDHGLLRRCHVCNFPYAFVQEPRKDTERAVDPRLKTHEFGESLRSELVWLFLAVHYEWLRGCVDTVIRPVPSSVNEATKELLSKVVEEEDALGDWIRDNFEVTADYVHATSARVVKQMIADYIGVKTGEANQALEALGYRDVRTKYGYRYRDSKGWLQRRAIGA